MSARRAPAFHLIRVRRAVTDSPAGGGFDAAGVEGCGGLLEVSTRAVPLTVAVWEEEVGCGLIAATAAVEVLVAICCGGVCCC